jgi:hypothetical protein
MKYGAQIVEHIVKSENVRSRNDASSEVLLSRDQGQVERLWFQQLVK